MHDATDWRHRHDFNGASQHDAARHIHWVIGLTVVSMVVELPGSRTSAIILGMVALLVAFESTYRLIEPRDVRFGEAMPAEMKDPRHITIEVNQRIPDICPETSNTT